MKCYNCEGIVLHPVRLDHGLPARQCRNCEGIQIELLTYRAWLEDWAPDSGSADIGVDSVDDNQKALVCQRCSRIMLKYRISTEHANHVDICSTCDYAWLDSGEWDLLKHLHLQRKLTAITSEPWQRHMREKAAAKSLEQRFSKILGAEDYDRLRAVEQWIAEHDHKSEINRYLHIKLGE